MTLLILGGLMNPLNIKEKLADILDLPKDIIFNLCKIIIYGNRVAIVENFVSLIDYDESNVVLKLKKGQIKILGNNITIKELSHCEINIFGEFHRIELIP
jgi:sporulation protein YqfC